MKRILFLIVIMALFLSACSGQPETLAPTETPTAEVVETPAPVEDRLNVIATIFPQYDFIRQIAGDRVDLAMLISPGAESHAFEPTPRDMIALNEADLLIYVGGHGDTWVDAILTSLDNENIGRVALVDLVDTVEVEHDHDHYHGHTCAHDEHHHDCDDDHTCSDNHHHGDCSDDHHDCDDDRHSDCDDDHHHDCDDHDHVHLDEHVWTSPQNAILIVKALTETLSELDPANAEFFRENAARYIEELTALDAAFAEVVAQGVRQTVVFGDRFPFRYLMDAYGLDAHAAFIGCSAETQASPATLARLIELVEAEDIPVVFYIEFSNQLIANVIAEATGARLLEIHSAHNVSAADFAAGVTYVDLMRQNVEHLREALS
ncbi:MAG: metal ABC transporter substrate-binding protein [Oscillospiraceae bacterium]|nr:metal ABC transporter substrate-binding protein [Oscillospiraceae bacterium]